MENTIIFTHGIDIDGFGGAILGNLVFQNPKIVFADNFNLDDLFIENLQKNPPYENIYITDHCLSYEVCEKIAKCSSIVSRLSIFDHHKSRLGKEDKFNFVHLVVENEKGKQSGTSIFYDYLVNSNLLKPNNALDEFVKLTTLYDTWQWKEDKELGEKACRLNTLFQAVGRENYIKIVTNVLKRNKDKFEFNDEENKIIDNFINAFNKKVQEYINKIQIIDLNGLKVGYVETEDLYKNDIPEALRSQNNPLNISYVMMPLKDRESVSLRNIEDVDLAEVASNFGGGGHKYAASFPKSNPKFKDLQSSIKIL